MIVVTVKVSRGIEPFYPKGIDSADTSHEICMDKSQLLSNNPARRYRYTSAPCFFPHKFGKEP